MLTKLDAVSLFWKVY